MLESEWFRQVIALATSALTIWGLWLVGNKRIMGWVLGLVTQAFWVATIVLFDSWGLLPTTVALTIVYTRNIIKWRREEQQQQEAEVAV